MHFQLFPHLAPSLGTKIRPPRCGGSDTALGCGVYAVSWSRHCQAGRQSIGSREVSKLSVLLAFLIALDAWYEKKHVYPKRVVVSQFWRLRLRTIVSHQAVHFGDEVSNSEWL